MDMEFMKNLRIPSDCKISVSDSVHHWCREVLNMIGFPVSSGISHFRNVRLHAICAVQYFFISVEDLRQS